MGFGQLVIGPPGSGKTTYCNGMQQYLQLTRRKVAVINLDPANDALPYECAVDVADLAGTSPKGAGFGSQWRYGTQLSSVFLVPTFPGRPCRCLAFPALLLKLSCVQDVTLDIKRFALVVIQVYYTAWITWNRISTGCTSA
jgi:Conserved hypothetical ATP binding protein